MAKQWGTVLVFKRGTPKHEMERALESIKSLLEHGWLSENPDLRAAGVGVPYKLWDFDPERGSPVWYIP